MIHSEAGNQVLRPITAPASSIDTATALDPEVARNTPAFCLTAYTHLVFFPVYMQHVGTRAPPGVPVPIANVTSQQPVSLTTGVLKRFVADGSWRTP